jgi:glycosyltransferase involved in cell wall biosynthesis
MRLEARKRPVQLVEAMAKVRAAAPRAGVRLEILGEGSERAKVERTVDRLGAKDWVSLPGRVPRDTLKERYAASDVFVSPSVLESFGIAALEARVAGLPVVGRVGSGISEFVTDDVNGFLANDDEELVRRLTTLAVHPSVRSRMTAYNLKTDPAQGWDQVVQAAEAEYARARALAG